MNKGFSTLEVIIAMTIMVIVLSSVILISFGNQMSLASSESASEALKRAQALIERQQALARKDFNLVNSTTTHNGFYTERISVNLRPDFLTKEVVVEISWQSERGLRQSVELKTIVTDFSSSVGASTCNSSPEGNWSSPVARTYTLRASDLLPAGLSGTYPVTDLDAYRGKLYVTVGETAVNIDKTLFVFDISNQSTKPIYLGGTDNAGSTRDGLNAVKVAGDYAYVANAHDANFNSCSVGPSCAQLQVVDVSSPTSNWNPAIVSLKLATSSGARVTGSGGQAIGKNIFYKDGYIYLGLSKTGSGPEFHIIDVHTPLSPFWVGGWPTQGQSSLQPVNALAVRNGHAYLAHPTDSSNNPQEQLTIINIIDPRNPSRVGGFHANDNAGNGKSLALVGDTLYLGRTETVFSSNPEFHIIDVSNPTAVNDTPIGEYAADDSINDLLVRDYLSFILTNESLKILNTTNPSNIISSASIPMPSGSVGRSIDCEGNFIYVGSSDTAGSGYITVITSS